MPPVPTRSGSQGDRRGFDGLLKFCLFGCMPASLAVMVLFSWKIGLALGLISCWSFITLEAVSVRPDNNPSTFANWVRTQSRQQRRPVLLCLGDSLTHGNASASITPEIPHKLCSSLGLPTPEYGVTFSDPIWVVNAGQNCITSHTVFRERLSKALAVVHPDYVYIMIGTNDVRAMYKPSWCRQVVRINNLPEAPSLQVLERNLRGILDFIETASPQTEIAIATLPPMGEDFKKSPSSATTTTANDSVRQANAVIERVAGEMNSSNKNKRVTVLPVFDAMESVLEKQKRKWWCLPADYFALAAVIQNPIYRVVPFTSWNVLSRPFGFHLLSDGLHLNERGRDIVVDLIVDWLCQKNVAKAIAVKQ